MSRPEAGGWFRARDERIEAALTTGLFLAFAVLYFVLAMQQATVAGYRVHDNILFGADQADALKGWTGNHKGSHPFDLLLVVPLSGLLGGVFRSYERGLWALGAIIGATAVAAFYRLCRILLDRASCLPLALVFGLGMNQLVFGPMAETYVLAGLSVLPGYALLALYLTTGRFRLTEWIFAGVVSFGITFTCFSQAAICFGFVLWRRGSWRLAAADALKFLAAVILIVTSLSIVQKGLYPDAQYFFAPSSLEHDLAYMSDDAAEHPGVVAWDVLKTLLVHAVVGQPPLVADEEPGQWAELVYTRAPLNLGALGTIAALLWLALLARGAYFAFRERRTLALQGAAALAWLCNAVFHSFFSPDEIFLFTPFFWAPMLLMVVSSGSFRGRLGRLPWWLLAVLIGVNNIAVIQAYTAEHRGPTLKLLVPRDAVWRYWPGSQPPPDDWASPQFGDSSWRSGKSGFGYADRDDATVLSDMESRYTTLYVRHRFTVENPAAVEELVIAVDYDDGFALYLNGRLAVSQNAPETITYRSVAEDDHDAGDIEEFRVPGEFLVKGANTIAAVGLNRAVDSSDFSLRIMLASTSNSSSTSAEP